MNHDDLRSVVVDRYVDPAVDYELKVYDEVCRPDLSSANASITLTLPRVAEARGRTYSILLRATGGGRTVTIQDQDDSEAWCGDIILDTVNDCILAYSDGLTWFVWARALNAAS